MNSVFVNVLVVALLFRAAALQADIDIRLQPASNNSEFDVGVVGIAADDVKVLASLPNHRLGDFFKLTVQQTSDIKGLPPVLGTTLFRNGGLVFQPQFPLIADKVYQAEFVSPSTRITIRRPVIVPHRPLGEQPQVRAVYPTSSVLPRNVLKFYLHFSAPMQQGNVYRHLTLEKADGTKLESPFLEISEELWDHTGTRLTLLFDPGRVKQGLIPREEDGPIFEVGESYRFTIHSHWPDANGHSLAVDTVKTFSIGQDDLDQPNPRNWKVHPPPRGHATSQKSQDNSAVMTTSGAGLRIDVPESLDHALFQRCIVILDQQRMRVEGDIEIFNDEKSWLFKPRRDWQAGDYTIEIDDIIEDLAGNSIGRPFEVKTSDTTQRATPLSKMKFYFTIPNR